MGILDFTDTIEPKWELKSTSVGNIHLKAGQAQLKILQLQGKFQTPRTIINLVKNIDANPIWKIKGPTLTRTQKAGLELGWHVTKQIVWLGYVGGWNGKDGLNLNRPILLIVNLSPTWKYHGGFGL